MMDLSIYDEIVLGSRFVFRRREGQLLSGGKRIAIGSRALEVLAALAERSGETVSKTQLMDRVWPDTIVEENNLQVQVSSLRKALGEDAIATVPGRGYRLCLAVGSVRRADDGPVPVRSSGVVERRQSLLGRDKDLARILEMLEPVGAVTLTGPGGVGKTSLARLVSELWHERSRGGIVWADLAPLRDSTMLVSVLAAVVGIELPSGESTMAGLVRLLKHRSELLVLDNAEHLADAVAEFAVALRAVEADLRLLITSREPLHVQHERVYRLRGLEVPEPGSVSTEEALQTAAVALFVRCAGNADSNFAPGKSVADIAAICRRLDGLPLAIEMAASRVASLGVAGLKGGLEQHWRLLTSRTRATSSRQQTLEATLDWSYALLESEQQRTLRRLALFANGFTLEAAREVAAEPGGEDWAVADALGDLIDKSMVVVEPTEPPRYRLLETVRAYALDKLATAGELATIRSRLLNWLLDFYVDADERAWTTPDRTWQADVRPELANLRAALSGAFEDPCISDVAIRLVAVALLTWARLGEEETEARVLADKALAQVGTRTDRATEARLQFGRGLYYGLVDVHVSMQSFRRALDLADGSLGARDRAHLLLEYARVLARAGDFPAAERTLNDASTASAALSISVLNGLMSLAWALLRGLQARPAEAREHAETGVNQFELVHASTLAAMARNDVADHTWAAGDLSAAETLLRKIVDESGQNETATTDRTGVPQMNLASVLAERGDVDQALAFARKALPLLRVSDRMWSSYDCLSLIAVLRGDYDLAARLHGFSDAEYAKRGVSIRERNEARLHDRVARALREHHDASSLHRAMALARTLDADAACKLFLRLGPDESA